MKGILQHGHPKSCGFIRSKLTVLVATLLIGLVTGKASLLSPGGSLFPAPLEPDPLGGTTLFSTDISFSSSVLSGRLISKVISNDLANALGGLTFTYQIQLSNTSANAASQLSVSRYGSFLTDASYFTNAASTIAPSFISRSNEGGGVGDVMQFHFGPPGATPEITPGGLSALLVVQTSSLNWQMTTASIIDGVAVPNITSLAPLTIPEPSHIVLGLSSFFSVCLFRRLSRNRK